MTQEESKYVISRIGNESQNHYVKNMKRSFSLKTIIKQIQWIGNFFPFVQSWKIGYFRRSGEVHHLLYDDVSMSKLMSDAGFVNINLVSASISGITNWGVYSYLDVESGKERKPDSLYIESTKP